MLFVGAQQLLKLRLLYYHFCPMQPNVVFMLPNVAVMPFQAGRLPSHPLNAGRGPLAGSGPLRPGPGPYGPGMHPHMGPGLDPIEQTLATQHATHQELQPLQQVLGGVQAEKEQHFRSLAEKAAKLDAALLATEPVKTELQKLQADAQQIVNHRIQKIAQELHKSRAEAQQVPTWKSDVDGLRQEIQRARTAFEFEKKANTDLLDSVEKYLVSLAREVEKLRAELTNTEKKSRAGGYGGGGFGGADSGYPLSNVYGDGYGIGQIGAATENGPFGSGLPSTNGPLPSWGAYDMQHGGASHARR